MRFADNSRKTTIVRMICWAWILGTIGMLVESWHTKSVMTAVIHAFHDMGISFLVFWIAKDLVFGLPSWGRAPVMKIWLLGGKVAKFYGEYNAFVVRAESPEIARELAIEFIKKDGAYGNARDFLTCPIDEVTTEGSADVILVDFKDG